MFLSRSTARRVKRVIATRSSMPVGGSVRRMGGKSGATIKHAYPPSGGIPAATWNATDETMTPGRASCLLADYDNGVFEKSENTVMVENPVGAVVGISGKPMTIGLNIHGQWTVLVEDCTGTTTTVTETPAPADSGDSNGSRALDMGFSLGV